MPRTLLVLVIVWLMGVSSSGADTSTSRPSAYAPRFPVVKDGRRGYIDRSGRLVIQNQFEIAEEFSEGLALVGIGKRRWFINEAGDHVMDSPFTDLQAHFSEGIACGQIGHEFRYINRKGEFLKGSFGAGMPFSEGLAAVMVEVAKEQDAGKGDYFTLLNRYRYGYIDHAGRQVITPQFMIAQPFSEGLAVVCIEGKWEQCMGLRGSKSGFIDRSGKLVIPATFTNASAFSEGLARVEQDNRIGYIDKTGRFAVPLRPLLLAGSFCDGLAYARSSEAPSGVYGDFFYIDKSGKTILQPDQRFSAYNFSEGWVESYLTPDGKCGWIDRTGKWLVKPQFDHVQRFRDGLAYFDVDGKIGYIDTTGKIVWPPSE